MRVLGAYLLLSLLSCSGESDDFELVHDNSGSLCVRSTANGPIFVRATASTCLSSSCSKVEQATCSISVEGTHITIRSVFRVRQPAGNVVCTADCGFLTAECTSATSLPAGEFSVQYGNATATLVVPSPQTILFSTDDGPSTFACQ